MSEELRRVLALQRGEAAYETFLAENWKLVQPSDQSLTVRDLLSFEVPEGVIGWWDTFNVYANHPQAYNTILFHISKNGTRVNNIEFTPPFLHNDRPPRLDIQLKEQDVIAVRYQVIAGVQYLFPLVIFGRITGRLIGKRPEQ